MRYQAVIFDFDYTLGDATEGIVQSVRHGLKKLGWGPMEREDIRKTIGLSLEETYRRLTEDKSPEQAKLFSGYFREMADQIMVEQTELFPDTRKALAYLKEKEILTGIVTTKYHYRMDAILEKFQAADYFDRIVGGEDVSVPKPDPEGVFWLLDVWKLPKERVRYVGDSLVDAKTAEAAGVDFAGVTTGTTGREELEAYPCIGVYEGLSPLFEKVFDY